MCGGKKQSYKQVSFSNRNVEIIIIIRKCGNLGISRILDFTQSKKPAIWTSVIPYRTQPLSRTNLCKYKQSKLVLQHCCLTRTNLCKYKQSKLVLKLQQITALLLNAYTFTWLCRCIFFMLLSHTVCPMSWFWHLILALRDWIHIIQYMLIQTTAGQEILLD